MRYPNWSHQESLHTINGAGTFRQSRQAETSDLHADHTSSRKPVVVIPGGMVSRRRLDSWMLTRLRRELTRTQGRETKISRSKLANVIAHLGVGDGLSS